jgi:outer membrane beta-barrel protein
MIKLPSIALLFLIFAPLFAHAADPNPSPTPDSDTVDVSKVTEKYWAQGKDTELGVVQNRKYSSEHRFEFDLTGGIVSTDPFLSVNTIGGSIGYYFNQYFSAHVFAWKDSVSTSGAYASLKEQAPNASVYLNPPRSFYGVELNENILYGKASLFGSAIIYVDIYALGGAGINDTDSGNDFTAFVGLGQKIHLNKYMALDLNYRIMLFNETVVNPVGGATQTRSNTTDAVTLGICFFY